MEFETESSLSYKNFSRFARGTPPTLPYYQHTIQNNILELYKAIADLAMRMGIGVQLYEVSEK